MKARVHWIARITRAPACRWKDIGPWWARARRWILHTVLREPGESCDACGGRVHVAWWALGEVAWPTVYSHLLGEEPVATPWGICGGLLCVGCFSRGVDELGLTARVVIGFTPGRLLPDPIRATVDVKTWGTVARLVFSGRDLADLDLAGEEVSYDGFTWAVEAITVSSRTTEIKVVRS